MADVGASASAGPTVVSTRRFSSAVHARLLWCLLGLFVIRVIAQPLSLAVSQLPDFESWQSGVVPYPLLLATQVLIAAVFAILAASVSAATVNPRRGMGMLFLAVGATYFGAMLARLVLGATLLSNHHWFARPLPTTFHLVLAGFLLVYGHFHVRHGR
jgi:uncharacterized protein